jgi:hypothetical protein
MSDRNVADSSLPRRVNTCWIRVPASPSWRAVAARARASAMSGRAALVPVQLLVGKGLALCLYRPLWSEAVLEELEYHEEQKHLKRGVPAAQTQNKAQTVVGNMRAHFFDAVVTDWEPLEGSYGRPARDDRHVLAAAVVGAPARSSRRIRNISLPRWCRPASR